MGDEMLLFLEAVDPLVAEFHVGFPTHTPVSLDGVAYIHDGRIAEVEMHSPVGASLLGVRSAELAGLIAVP